MLVADAYLSPQDQPRGMGYVEPLSGDRTFMHHDYCVVAGRFPSTQSYFPHESGYMMQNFNSAPVLRALTNWRLKDLSLISGGFTEVV